MDEIQYWTDSLSLTAAELSAYRTIMQTRELTQQEKFDLATQIKLNAMQQARLVHAVSNAATAELRSRKKLFRRK